MIYSSRKRRPLRRRSTVRFADRDRWRAQHRLAAEQLERRILLTTVTGVDPLGGSLDAPVTTDVSATFAEDVAPASDQTFVIHSSQRGQLLGSATAVSTAGNVARHDPASDFFAGELVQATVTSELATAGGSHVWQFRAAPLAGSGLFTDTGQSLGVAANNTMSFALALGDVDADGDLDIFMANSGQPSTLYLNNGSGEFTDSGQDLGASASRDVEFGDLDGDGDLDAVVANASNQGNRVWQNDGNGVFSEAQSLGANSSQEVKLGDFDGDGDLDAFFGNTGGNRVWLNNGGSLGDSGQSLGNNTTLGVDIADIDGDGDLDAFTGNTQGQSDRVWVNNGNGQFTDSGQLLGNAAVKSSRDVVMGDVDGDGDVDAFVVGRGYQNRLFLNDSNGVFTDSGQIIDAQPNPWFDYGASLGDIDADGDLDLVTSAESIVQQNRVWVNDGNGVFMNSGQNLGGGAPYATNAMSSFGIELGDLDGDGALDIAIANRESQAMNNSTGRVWLNQNLTPSVTLAVDNDSIAEAAGTATISATLSAAHSLPVTIELGFGGSAAIGDDYTASNSQIVIAAGSTTESITITAIQDAADEPDETATIDITGTTNAREAGSQQVVVTILDDDMPPMPNVTLALDAATIPEAAGVATFTVTLSEPTTVPVTVELGSGGTATETADYTVSATQLVFDAGATTETVTVTAVQDDIEEPDETVTIDVVSVVGGNEIGVQTATTTIVDDDVPPSFVVSSLTPTDSGFDVEFSSTLDSGDINLYDTDNADLGDPDVMVIGAASGPVAGSLIIDGAVATFIKSGGPLVADTYTVTLRSSVAAFEDTDRRLLDGDGDGTAGDDYVTTFVREAIADARMVGIPDFVRGPGQAVNLPADQTTGIPLVISEGENVRAADIRIGYDPALLEITGATAPAGGTVVLNTTTAPGVAILVYFSSTALPSGASTLINLQASVPTAGASEAYQGQQVLDVHSVTIGDGNDNEFPVVVDDAIHFVTYFADVSGNGRVNASDAAQVARFAALIDTGFAASLTTDPIVAGDISGNGRINSADASRVAQFAALVAVPEIPPVPGGIVINGMFAGPPPVIGRVEAFVLTGASPGPHAVGIAHHEQSRFPLVRDFRSEELDAELINDLARDRLKHFAGAGELLDEDFDLLGDAAIGELLSALGD